MSSGFSRREASVRAFGLGAILPEGETGAEGAIIQMNGRFVRLWAALVLATGMLWGCGVNKGYVAEAPGPPVPEEMLAQDRASELAHPTAVQRSEKVQEPVRTGLSERVITEA